LVSLAILSGWFLLLKYREPNSTWRAVVAAVASICLTASLPVFLYELSSIRWEIRYYPLQSMYVRPWVHWGYQGYIPLLWGVVGSFFGRGWARSAFVVGAILLLTLRNSLGWIAP